MYLASVDVGSNTLRLLIGRASKEGFVPVRYERVITRLASGITETGVLGKAEMEKTLQVLKDFSEIIGRCGVRHVKAVGTSALREAKNSGEFLNRVLSETGINIEVISGQKEAELTAKGVLSSLPLDKKQQMSLIVDIGGGSTEWILCREEEVLRRGTIPVGVVKLVDKYIKSDPPSKEEIQGLGVEAEGVAETVKKNVIAYTDSDMILIGTAGTATTLAAIDLELEDYSREKVHGHEISLDRLKELFFMLVSLSLKDRSNVKGLEPERADLIIPGILLTIKLIEALNGRNILISDHGLLEGALLTLSMEVQK
jgi:exopolyphosphatase/guanosine-5'-triphosphate,3'-diphosphate pyrophosphatase